MQKLIDRSMINLCKEGVSAEQFLLLLLLLLLLFLFYFIFFFFAVGFIDMGYLNINFWCAKHSL